MMQHAQFLERCLEIAQEAVDKGDQPFGALVALDGKVVVSSVNEVFILNDVTAHAELRVVQKAQKRLSLEELSRSTLYTSTEPCPMCAGAIYWAGINHVVFGCSQEQLYSVVRGGLELKTVEVFKTGARDIKVEDFSADLRFVQMHKDFWKKT